MLDWSRFKNGNRINRISDRERQVLRPASTINLFVRRPKRSKLNSFQLSERTSALNIIVRNVMIALVGEQKD